MHKIQPYGDHLEVTTYSGESTDHMLWVFNPIAYRYVEINGVPIIAFIFTDRSLNFFIPINYPAVKDLGTSEWLEQENIKIVLIVSDQKGSIPTYNSETILSFEDSEKIRLACKHQEDDTIERVEAAIDFIYANNVAEYEWLQ